MKRHAPPRGRIRDFPVHGGQIEPCRGTGCLGVLAGVVEGLFDRGVDGLGFVLGKVSSHGFLRR